MRNSNIEIVYWQPAFYTPEHCYTATIHYSQHAWYIFDLFTKFRHLPAVALSHSPPFIPPAAIPLNPDGLGKPIFAYLKFIVCNCSL